jgi:predicted nucleotidyltransferase
MPKLLTREVSLLQLEEPADELCKLGVCRIGLFGSSLRGAADPRERPPASKLGTVGLPCR